MSRFLTTCVLLVSPGSAADLRGQAPASMPAADAVDCYRPVEGGWQIRITGDSKAKRLAPGSAIGAVVDNPRLHRRPLFPPADRTMLFKAEDMRKIQRCGFRPIVLAYNEPRFLFDYHSAGGLLGHLFIGLTSADGAGKWLHHFSELDVRYVDGRMEYTLSDPAYPGVVVSLSAIPLADSAGAIIKVAVKGASENTSLVWACGGASAFFTNYAMTAPEFVFAPQQCAKDVIHWEADRFALQRAFDQSDVCTKEAFAVMRHLPDWKARIRGGSAWQGAGGFGDPNHFAVSPADLCKSAEWSAPNAPVEKRNVLAVQKVLLRDRPGGFIVVGMGGNIEEAIGNPAAAWEAALQRNRTIAERIVTRTPDPHLDAAVRMMAFATEGTWGDSAFVHGGWSWRFAYLGWRILYGPDCYGWTDRVRRTIENHATLGLVREGIDKGALGSLLEYSPGVFYNMNEVFLDHVRHYFDYTGDLEMMRKIFSILEGIVEWEGRRLQPAGECLYENSLNTWISDSHWYIQGQCTQASAYMLGANRFLADLAGRLGKDPGPFRERAEKIRAAMQKKLWMPREGVFAEYLDTRGHKLLHPEPELPTIYHSAEFGAANTPQILQMLRWADTHLRCDVTPNGGRLYWSSNWFPNSGRSYTHSTYEVAYAEELNFALTNYLAGRADEAYAILQATLCGIFNGPTPGGLSCHSYSDGRQRANDEFADASSMWGRAVAEGLFGILPKRPDGIVILSPQFPCDWSETSVAGPHFSYHWKREGDTVSMDWKSPVQTAVRLRLPMRAEAIRGVVADGKPIEYQVEPAPNATWVTAQTWPATGGTILVSYAPSRKPAPRIAATREGDQPIAAFPRKVWSAPKAGDRDLQRWVLVDLTRAFNAPLTEVLDRVLKATPPPPLPASRVGFDYWKSHFGQYHGTATQKPSDAAWRDKIGPDEVGWTTDGIPFKSPKNGPNIGVVTLAGGFPAKVEFPVNGQGRTLYLMVTGMTFPVQSHVVNLRVTLLYADGTNDVHDLVSPFDIGDCWSTWCSRFHDTAANGFENLGGRFGPAGSARVADMTRPISVDTEAHLVPIDLKPDVGLRTAALEAVANDTVFGIMGATILK